MLAQQANVGISLDINGKPCYARAAVKDTVNVYCHVNRTSQQRSR